MADNTTLKDRVKTGIKEMATGKRGVFGVTLAGFLESSFLSFPLEALLVPAFHMAKSRAWVLATAVLIGCLLAAITFYFFGMFLNDAIIDQVAGYLGITKELEEFYDRLNNNGFWVIFLVSLLPAPLQVASLGSGAAGYSFELFVLAVALSRMIRFYGLVVLTLLLGDELEKIIRGVPRYLLVIGSVLILGGALWYLFAGKL